MADSEVDPRPGLATPTTPGVQDKGIEAFAWIVCVLLALPACERLMGPCGVVVKDTVANAHIHANPAQTGINVNEV